MYNGLSNGYSLDYPNSNERSDINWKKNGVDMNLYEIININRTLLVLKIWKQANWPN